EDYEIASVVNVSTFARFQMPLATGDITGEFEIGQVVYFGNTSDVNLAPSGFYTITDVVFTVGLQTALDTSTPYTDGGNGYLNNQSTHENYKVNIQVWDVTETIQLIPLTFKFSPEPSGFLFIDMAEIITEYQEDNNLVSLEYILKYGESYTGSPPAFPRTVITSWQNSGGLLGVGWNDDFPLPTASGMYWINFVDTYVSGWSTWGVPMGMFELTAPPKSPLFISAPRQRQRTLSIPILFCNSASITKDADRFQSFQMNGFLN
ncbi:unnamed protein product, partial [marine sediment metagenome]